MDEISKELVQQVLRLPARQMWTDYDADADVLYISFRKPQQANDSMMESDGNIYHYHDDELVGITVLNASRDTTIKKSTRRPNVKDATTVLRQRKEARKKRVIAKLTKEKR